MAAPAMLDGDISGQVLRLGYEITDVKASEEDGQGLIEAIVSVFNNVDRYQERILPGAFKKSINKKLPKGVWMHDWRQPVAKTLVARETSEGLYVKGQFNLETQRGREAYSDVKNGLVDEFSIGFRVVKYAYDKEKKLMDLLELELFEWSPVLVGANPATRPISVKSDLGSLGGLRFSEHSDAVLTAVKEYVLRAKSYGQLRAADDNDISTSRRTEFLQLRDALTELLDTTPESDERATSVADRLRLLRLDALRADADMEHLEI